jgi:hypothetical protein
MYGDVLHKHSPFFFHEDTHLWTVLSTSSRTIMFLRGEGWIWEGLQKIWSAVLFLCFVISTFGEREVCSGGDGGA